MKKYKLRIYDGKVAVKNEIHFIRSLFRRSGKAMLLAVLFVGMLVGLDYLGRFVFQVLSGTQMTWLTKTYAFLDNINHIWGVRYIDFFKDVIVMVAGILGVILGLFFTTYINIISTKYAHLSPIIIYQVLDGEVINKYFRFLTILVTSAIGFQFLLYCGYSPTIISSSIFTLTIIVAIISFVSYGKYSMMYFDAARVVSDIVKTNVDAINRVTKNRKYIGNDKASDRILKRIFFNNTKISEIIKGSKHPQLANTSYGDVSNELRKFAIGFNMVKSIFPSNKDWFTTTYVHQKWQDASMTEIQMYNRPGFNLAQKQKTDYNSIEKQLIEIQFLIFDHYADDISDELQLLGKQSEYLQVASFQCEIEIFKSYFDNLEKLVFARLNDKNSKLNQADMVSLASVYANHLIQYLVGFNIYFNELIVKEKVKKLASEIHSGKEITSVISVPYKIRKWIDDYQSKLNKEAYYEGKILTPLFHTEYELANQLQLVFKTHIVEVLDEIYGRVSAFGQKLIKGEHYLETIEFLFESLDIVPKSRLFTENVANVITVLSELNLPKETPFDFNERGTTLIKCDAFEKETLAKIWDIGIHSHVSIQIDDLPDMFGSIYNLLCKDIVKKALENRAEFTRYFQKFLVFNAFYGNELRMSIDFSNTENIRYRSMKIYPVVVDLFEICSIAVILFKMHNDKKLEKVFFDGLDNIFDEETCKKFWTAMIGIYEWYKDPNIRIFAQPNLVQQERERSVSDYLKSSDIVQLEEFHDHFLFYSQRYVTDSKDIYLKSIVRRLRTGHDHLEHLDLADLFLEFYLRKKPCLQDLTIKETEHGKYIKTHDSE